MFAICATCISDTRAPPTFPGIKEGGQNRHPSLPPISLIGNENAGFEQKIAGAYLGGSGSLPEISRRRLALFGLC
jgi:hypothetical protein